MSGIYGALCLNKSNIDQIRLEKWNLAYGETNDNYSSQRIYLGVSTDNPENAAQKKAAVFRTDGKVAVIDALLYNREELLQKYGLNSQTSSEQTLFKIVLEKGSKALKDVHGDFCGALYDEKEQRLLLFRDHVGIRPLFFYFDGNTVVFSSDFRGITSQGGLNLSANKKMFYNTSMGRSTLRTTETELSNVFCVQPGGYAVFEIKNNNLSFSQGRYWTLKRHILHLSNKAEYIKTLRAMIEDSIAGRLAAINGKVGAELSGGLDSSVISILIKRMGRDCTYFSWAHSPEEVEYAEADERLRIKEICEREGITCNWRPLTLKYIYGDDSWFLNSYRKLGIDPNQSEGILMGFVLPTYMNSFTISAAAYSTRNNGARVIFSGHGGDEGVSHRSNPFEMLYHHEIIHYLRQMWKSTYKDKNRVLCTFQRCFNNITSNVKKINNVSFTPSLPEHFFNVNFEKEMKKVKPNKYYFACNPVGHINGGGCGNRLDNTALQGAYNGVRYIFPYLDYRVLEYAVSVPRYMYLNGNKNRYIFREAFKDILPESIVGYFSKEDTSFRTIRNRVEKKQTHEDRVKIAQNQLRDILVYVNRETWKSFINFEVIDEWAKRQYINQDEIDAAMNVADILAYCASIDNMIIKSKNV